jgi:hypothetical protein
MTDHAPDFVLDAWDLPVDQDILLGSSMDRYFVFAVQNTKNQAHLAPKRAKWFEQ